MNDGEVCVDAGLIWIGDPCYVLGDDASHRVTDWIDFCDKVTDSNGVSAPLGHGTGLAISTGYGDGCYPVDVEYNGEGRVSKVTVTFIEEDYDE
jgi:hypothetical protein